MKIERYEVLEAGEGREEAARRDAVALSLAAIVHLVDRRGFPAELAADALIKAAWLVMTRRLGCAPLEAEELGRKMFAILGKAAARELGGDLGAAVRDLGGLSSGAGGGDVTARFGRGDGL